MTQRVAILGGGDWVDASVDLINLPDDVELQEAAKQYRLYVEDRHLAAKLWYAANPDWRSGKVSSPYPSVLDFKDWLMQFCNGTESDVIEFWE